MIKRKAEDEVEVEVDSEMRKRKIVYNEPVSTRQSRWTDLLLAATEAMHVSSIVLLWIHNR